MRGLNEVHRDPQTLGLVHTHTGCAPVHIHTCTKAQQYMSVCTHNLIPHNGVIVLLPLVYACTPTVVDAHVPVIHLSG